MMSNDDLIIENMDWSFSCIIYSWSISHILEDEFFCLGRLGSNEDKTKLKSLSAP